MSRASERPLGAGALRTLVVILATALLLATLAAGSAQADELTVFSCHDPAGEAVGHDGWVNSRTADEDLVAQDSCTAAGAGSLSLELEANAAGYENAAQTEWIFQAPPWASIASYTLDLAGSYAIPSTGGGSGQAFVTASDESDPNYDYRNLGSGAQGAWVIARTPPAPVQSLTLNASCDGQSGPCPADARVSELSLTSAQIVLRDGTSPTVTELSGNLLPGNTVRGSGEADFTAADSGPGIYSAQLSVDGTPQAAVLLDGNGGWCVDLGETSDGTRSFAHPDPCLTSLSGAVSLDTTALRDGEHDVRLSVDDASGNATTAFNGTITTHNTPVSSAGPTVTSSSALGVGSQLAASTGTWSAPAGAGALSYGYQWQDCDSHGGECEAIAGADSTSYTTTLADVGHTIRVLVSVSDNDGLSSTASAATGTLSAPAAPATIAPTTLPGAANGSGASETATLRIDQPGALTRSYAKSALTIVGSLTDGQGHPIGGAALDMLESVDGGTRVIGHAATGSDGGFTARLAAGSSRTMLVAYRAYSSDTGYAASATVRESVLAAVRLSVTPRQTRPTGTIVLSGRVLGAIPRSGVIVELLVRYHGAWEPFRTPRTDEHGRFRVAYQFQGASGRFPFRAAVPSAQASFPYLEGRSSIVTVRSG